MTSDQKKDLLVGGGIGALAIFLGYVLLGGRKADAHYATEPRHLSEGPDQHRRQKHRHEDGGDGGGGGDGDRHEDDGGDGNGRGEYGRSRKHKHRERHGGD